MNNGNGENEDPNNAQNQGSNNKIKNIILINNASPNATKSNTDNENLWSQSLFGLNKLPNSGFPFISETLQKPGFSNLFNFNVGICPEFDKKKDYYKEFWRIYLQNEIILIDMKDYVVEIKTLQNKIKEVEELHKTLEEAKQLSLKEKGLEKKKNRRPANEIQKNHLCPYESCNKFYGSEVSLNLHIKLKHKGGNKTDREKLAISIVKAKMNGENVPELNLNLPPGYLEMYQSQLHTDTLQNLKNENSSTGDIMKLEESTEEIPSQELKNGMSMDEEAIKITKDSLNNEKKGFGNFCKTLENQRLIQQQPTLITQKVEARLAGIGKKNSI